MRTIVLVLAALFGVGLIITSGPAHAAASVAPPPVIPPPGGATLSQGSADTWTASVYLDTAALCDDSFNLVTSSPDTDNPAKPVTYDGTATKAWIMLVASSFTAFGMGAVLGLIGWVLTYQLVVAPGLVRLCIGIGIGLVGLIFLGNVCASILAMADRPQNLPPPRAETVARGVPAARASRPSLL